LRGELDLVTEQDEVWSAAATMLEVLEAWSPDVPLIRLDILQARIPDKSLQNWLLDALGKPEGQRPFFQQFIDLAMKSGTGIVAGCNWPKVKAWYVDMMSHVPADLASIPKCIQFLRCDGEGRLVPNGKIDGRFYNVFLRRLRDVLRSKATAPATLVAALRRLGVPAANLMDGKVAYVDASPASQMTIL
jgi:hypothetical protein